MKDRLWRKSLVIVIISLFIGIIVAPSVNQSITKASTDNDLVEVTTQACGINGYEDTTVKLTKQQYQDLEQYLVVFRAKLNQTTTREEAVPIFKEAVAELDTYGLLPKKMSVEKAQNLLLQQKKNDHLIKLQERFLNSGILREDNENYFSLIAGNTTRTLILGLFPLTCMLTGLIGLLLTGLDLNIILIIIGLLLLASSVFIGLLFYSSPGTLFSVIRIGGRALIFDPGTHPEPVPSKGWIYSAGLAGKKTWVGPFYGNMMGIFSIGVVGFIGLKIALNIDHCFYLGSAMKIGISPEPPPLQKK